MIKDDYKDIIDMPRHVSTVHKQMDLYSRSAQFAPFAALTGYGDIVSETARLTEKKAELDESYKEKLNRKLQILKDKIGESPKVSFTYFVQDLKKTGGAYITAVGVIKKIDEYKKTVLLTDGKVIPIEEIFSIESDVFNKV